MSQSSGECNQNNARGVSRTTVQPVGQAVTAGKPSKTVLFWLESTTRRLQKWSRCGNAISSGAFEVRQPKPHPGAPRMAVTGPGTKHQQREGDARREKGRRRSSAVEVRHVGNVGRRLPLQAACGCLSLSERNCQPLFCFCGKTTHELKEQAGLLFIAHHRQVSKGNSKTATVHKNLGRPSSSSYCHSPRGELASHRKGKLLMGVACMH
ncbi:hypothetical protein BGZ61DRAFT_89482 [Ilyonectria robusta]|uniref:uncharacterized protein n=1 Tax=Ilyonectria robusta TaxID=1079257 RepID=UPI001E8CACBA|nr:uncharacterized protein BGZ61DRAFT_89482 [Ilyonectria robusta]KAH8735961.1 hypothetical protein BGZ61DRAFT_89482 [Ilyonectria robusta]